MGKPSVYVVVVTFNGESWLDQCLGSLINSDITLNIMVIDNNSGDGTSEKVREEYPEVTLVKLAENIGFGRANNIGIQNAIEMNAEFIFLLNQDAWVQKDTISELIKVSVSNPEYGIISPVHLNGNSTALDYNFSLQASPINCEHFFSDIFIGVRRDIYKAKFVNAAAWLITNECVRRVGFFEPLFFLYGEDDNYVQRASYHGFQIGITPNGIICHDRADRKGKKSLVGLKTENLTKSLMILLDITKPFTFCLLSFFLFNLKLLVKIVIKLDFSEVRNNLNQFFFVMKKYPDIQESRKRNKSNRN
jgi:GT2 family glycosyltransferase